MQTDRQLRGRDRFTANDSEIAVPIHPFIPGVECEVHMYVRIGTALPV